MNTFYKLGRVVASGALMLAVIGSVFAAVPVYAVQSPANCSADNSIVNISSDVSVAEVGDIITFSVEAGNPVSANGCDIDNRTVTLTLPNGSVQVFGPSNYPNPTATSVIGTAPYVAAQADLIGGLWTANVSWTGTLKGVSDLDSSGSKNISVNEVADLQVSKTAVPESRVSYEWTIDKSVTPATWNLFTGDSGTSEYTIALNKSVGTETNTVSGVITITNPNNAESATITGVSDVISGVGAVTVNCPVSFPHVLAAGGVLVCSYSSVLPDDTTRTNTATVATTGDVGGDSGEAIVDFSNVVPSVTNGEVNVDDTYALGDAGPFSNSASYTYTRPFACGTEQGQYTGTGNIVPNTATITETGQNDSAEVTVNCYDLTVTKTADTTFDREYDWNIEKTADATEITLATDQSYDINYTVTASVVGQTDSNFAVAGNITIANNNPTMQADLTTVIDTISVAIGAAVNCPATVVPASGSIVCTYSSALPDGTNRTNTATATQQNYSYDKNGVPTPAGTTNYNGVVAVAFGAPANVIDEQVNVTDTFAGVLGTVTVGESPKVFNYTRTVVYTDAECGDHHVLNTATLITNDTQTTDTDSWDVLVHIDCPQGCTLTQGYWKTHNDSFKGGAPSDDGWLNIGALKENELFFLTGKTWFEIFWTAPKGNVYYNLAHQYMAAKLNIENGATPTPAVTQAITDAENLFNTKTIAEAGALKGAAKNVWTSLAGTLGSFNEGLIGPGHCDEQLPL